MYHVMYMYDHSQTPVTSLPAPLPYLGGRTTEKPGGGAGELSQLDV